MSSQPGTSAARDHSGSLRVATMPRSWTAGAVAIRPRAAIVLTGSMFISVSSQSVRLHRFNGTSRARIRHCWKSGLAATRSSTTAG